MDVIATASEYLVKLGVQMDTKNMAKVEAFLKNGKVQAAAMGVAMGALGKAVYSFVKTNTEFEISLKNSAKAGSKAITNLRAQNNVLKAMGKTLGEIKQDRNLKAIYDDLIKMGKAIQMPKMDGVLKSVYDLQGAFYGLKTVVQYTMQWINFSILKEMKGPMGQVTNLFTKVRTWLQENMTTVARNIGIVIGDLGRGLMGIFSTVSQIGNVIGHLPDGVKALGAAFLAIKSGPLGIVLSSLFVIGDLIKDWENYNWNKSQDPENQVEIRNAKLWDMVAGEGSLSDKINGAIDMVASAFTGENGGLFTQIEKWIAGKDGQAVIQFGKDLGDWIVKGISQVDNIAARIVGAFFGGVTGDEDLQSKVADNPVWGIVGTAILQNLFGVDGKTTLLTSLAQLFMIDTGDQNIVDKLADFGGTIWDLFTKGLVSANKGIGDLIVSLIESTNGIGETEITQALRENSDVYTGIGETILGFIFGGVGGGLLTGILNLLSGIQAGDLVKATLDNGDIVDISNMGLDVGDVFDGHEITSTDTTPYAKRIEQTFSDIIGYIKSGIKTVTDFFDSDEGKNLASSVTKAFNSIWEELNKDGGILSKFGSFGQDIIDSIADAFAGLWDAIQPYLFVIGRQITQWMYNTFDNDILNFLGLDRNKGNKYAIDENGKVTTADLMIAKGYNAVDVGNAVTKANEAGYENFNTSRYVTSAGSSSGLLTFANSNGFGEVSKVLVDAQKNGNASLFNALLSAYEKGMSYYDVPGVNREDPAAQRNSVDWFKQEFAKNILMAASSTTDEKTIKELMAGAKELGIGADDITNASTSLQSSGQDLSAAATMLIEAANSLSNASTDGPAEAWGGRIDHEMNNVTVGEDGTEYIIPITKPKRAAELIARMVAEMGGSAASDLMAALGVSNDSTTIGGSLSQGISNMAPAINYYNNVTATTTINVNGTGDAKDIGRAAYNAHERYLVRTLQGVIG